MYTKLSRVRTYPTCKHSCSVSVYASRYTTRQNLTTFTYTELEDTVSEGWGVVKDVNTKHDLQPLSGAWKQRMYIFWYFCDTCNSLWHLDLQSDLEIFVWTMTTKNKFDYLTSSCTCTWGNIITLYLLLEIQPTGE